MRVVIQRVSSASVTVGERVTGRIDRGLLVYLGIETSDTAADGQWLANKLLKLRIFADEGGQMNRSLTEIGGGILLVSQFTLHASTAKGSRPSFNGAARPDHARPLYEQFIGQLSAGMGGSARVSTGEFGASMEVASINDGPVTLIIDSKSRD
jgi:D-tyrosyl-tRNA(Tyr) deacylase